MRSPNTSTHIAQNPWMKTSSPTYVNGRLSRVKESYIPFPVRGRQRFTGSAINVPWRHRPVKNRTLRLPIFNDLWFHYIDPITHRNHTSFLSMWLILMIIAGLFCISCPEILNHFGWGCPSAKALAPGHGRSDYCEARFENPSGLRRPNH